VKWLAEVHLQEDRFLGNYQARWYRSLVGVDGTGEDNDPGTQWVENEITRIHLKSAIARVRKKGDSHEILGFVLKMARRSIGGSADRQRAVAESHAGLDHTQYSWKLFTYRWEGATPGEHTLVSRVTDADGMVQPTARGVETEEDVSAGQQPVPAEVMIS
jgi:hypothetical protein